MDPPIRATTLPTMWDSVLASARTADKKYFVTSPNCTFVPEALVGRVVVALCADYRYGPPDPIQWPQILSPGWDYLCTVCQCVDSSDCCTVMWTNPTADQFEVISGCKFTSLGLFKKSSIVPLLHTDTKV